MDSKKLSTSVLLNIKELINTKKKILLVSHYSADGDAIGSSLGLYYFIKDVLSKDCVVYNRDGIPNYLSFLGADEIIHDSIETLPKDFDLALILDLNDFERTGSEMSNYLDLTIKDNDLPIIVIDHHENNKIENSEATYIDTDASSTGVLVYRLIKQFPEITNESVKSKISTCLLTTIITDTSSFKNSNVNPETFEICKELLSMGGDLETLNKSIFNNGEIKRLQLRNKIYSTLDFNEELKTAICHSTDSFYDQTGTTKEDSEGIANSLLNYSDVEIGIFIREIGTDKWKISLRSNGFKDLSDFAGRFGGGGHKNASGFRFDGKIQILIEGIIKELKNG